MKLHFYGADRCVTGSCHCLEINGKKILVDCGLQQGRDELDNRYLAFAPGNIDILLVTHAHIDHTGRIPLLVKNGFHGRILTTRLTADLMKIMLLDSAHIQESDAEYENRKGERAGREHVDPLYTEQDALDVFKYVTTCEYKEKVDLCEGVSAVFTDAGHLLGSASITLELEENGVHKTIVFSGDIGNVDQPIIRDPQLLKKADYVVMESTYGDRNHTEVWSYTDELAEIIDETLGKGGNVVIPSFAVGRTQELLYFIREIKDQKLVKSTPNFPVYIDSPLAKAATTVFCGDLHGYLDEQALELVKDGTHMFTFPNLNLVESSEESKMLNMDTTPKVIISASGMCDAGRIRHHLKHNARTARSCSLDSSRPARWAADCSTALKRSSSSARRSPSRRKSSTSRACRPTPITIISSSGSRHSTRSRRTCLLSTATRTLRPCLPKSSIPSASMRTRPSLPSATTSLRTKWSARATFPSASARRRSPAPTTSTPSSWRQRSRCLSLPSAARADPTRTFLRSPARSSA